MKLLPTLLIACGLLASPMVLAEDPPKHGEAGHDHAKDHGQTATPEAKPGVVSRNGKNSTLRVMLPSHFQELKPITAGCAIRCYMAVKRLACNPQFLA